MPKDLLDIEWSYKSLIREILAEGLKKETRNGATISLFGKTLAFDTSKTFPLIRSRKMFYKPVIGELAAMLKGPKHINDFKQYGCNYWDAWGAEKEGCLYDEEQAKGGELNLDYGNAWLDFNGYNQLKELINTLQTNPNNRRMIISAWRPDRLDELSLPCCHLLYQWYTRTEIVNEKEVTFLDMIWYQRSVDTMVGLPSDIILAAAWNIILANQCGFTSGNITMILGDTHIYENHLPQVDIFLNTTLSDYPNLRFPDAPSYSIDKDATVFNFKPEMLNINNYISGPVIKFELNV
ncbi:MAG: thymidylate synthase [Candidatus Komeilibacteria bacterium CG11_big_fil_rev_8_21_14_0_20_36_20]|uniref:Thymidylate synthase n=1 Tax=Candidatus Komeilibacteria bacterium CG11_big_fil_rev_8_21_14_0_20_36_20 TaxID=1974477 RepID=A0A2H0NCS5_9BACT|nr:MAG: thymidylate synthase [Candidatus Komeilibacteria bacterium CG11_big_fil_rev_8_21_14_0_20_36_20]